MRMRLCNSLIVKCNDLLSASSYTNGLMHAFVAEIEVADVGKVMVFLEVDVVRGSVFPVIERR